MADRKCYLNGYWAILDSDGDIEIRDAQSHETLIYLTPEMLVTLDHFRREVKETPNA